MTSPDRLKALTTYREEFYNDLTTDDRRVEILLVVQEWAQEEMPDSKCISCGKAGLSIGYDYALIEGHCYTQDGERDYQSITRQCEYCFDKMCKKVDPEDDSIPDVGPRKKG